MSNYYDKYGLLVSKPDYPNTEENSFLWSVEEYFLDKEADSLSEAQISVLRDSLRKMRVAYGLYAQNPLYAESEPLTKEKYMSRDQLMAIMAVSMDQGWNYHKEIWEVIKKQDLRYNNTLDGKNRWITPFDLAYYAYCSDSKIKYLFIWLVAISCIFSCLAKKEKTSGKLLSYVRCQSLKEKSWTMKLTWKICKRLVKFAEAFYIYFPYKDHPLVLKSQKVFN